MSRSNFTYHTEEITLNVEIVRLYKSIRVDERDLSRMVIGAIYLSLTAAWPQVSQTWFQKRSPSRNLGGNRSIRRSSATSRSSTALNFLFFYANSAMFFCASDSFLKNIRERNCDGFLA